MGLASLLALAGAELVLRAGAPPPLFTQPQLAPHGVAYAPGQHARYRTWEWDVAIDVNAHGFRDADRRAGEGSAGSVVVLGSSFVEGHGVALADTFVKRAQATLIEAGRDFWVYNAGHHATLVGRQARVYRERFRAVPDLKCVVLALCVHQDLGGPGHSDEAPPQVLSSPLRVFLSEHSALYNVVTRRVKSSAALRAVGRRMGFSAGDDPLGLPPYVVEATSPLLEHSLEVIRKLAAEVHADGRRFVVALMPMKEQVSDAFFEALLAAGGHDRARVDRFGAYHTATVELGRSGIEVVDFLPALQQDTAGPDRQFFEGDRHYSPHGHAVIGRALGRVLAAAPR